MDTRRFIVDVAKKYVFDGITLHACNVIFGQGVQVILKTSVFRSASRRSERKQIEAKHFELAVIRSFGPRPK